jgi:hypothetical protein
MCKVQPSFQGSNKLGLVETGSNQSLKYRLADSLFCGRQTSWLSNLVAMLSCKGPSWTAVYMSPLNKMQVDLEQAQTETQSGKFH